MAYNGQHTGAEIDELLDKASKVVVTEQIEFASTSIALDSNKYYRLTSAQEGLKITLNTPSDATIKNEYFIEFPYTSGSVSFPADIAWENGEMPTFEAGKIYQVSILNNLAMYAVFDGLIGEILPYVDSDGSDYVLTDYMMSSSDYGFKFKAAPLFEPTGSSHGVLAGTRNSSTAASTSCFMIWFFYTGNINPYWAGTESVLSAYTKDQVYEYSITNQQNNVASSYPLAVFGGNNNGTVSYYSGKPFRLYYLQVLDNNNNPRLHLVPMRRYEDDAIGLYDLIGKKFYTSANGTLIAGS